jgi:hypothetical protein
MSSPAAGLRQSALSFVGLLAGVWIAIAPWVMGYPQPSASWTASELSCIVAGAVVVAVSAACLVASATSSVHQVMRLADRAAEAPSGQDGEAARP